MSNALSLTVSDTERLAGEEKAELAAIDRASRRQRRAAALLMLSFFGGVGLWASVARVDGAALAAGSVSVEHSRKTVQHLEGGIVARIHVRDGQRVAADDPLVTLEDVRISTAYDRALAAWAEATARAARLTAERDGAPDLTLPESLTAVAGRADVADAIEGQRALLHTQREAVTSQVAILQERIGQFREAMTGSDAQVRSVATQIDLLEKDLTVSQEMMGKGLERRSRILELQRLIANLEGQLDAHKVTRARSWQSILETEKQIAELHQRRRLQAETELRESQAKIADLTEQLRAFQDARERLVVRAPVAGEVIRMRFHTLGGVVKASEPILDIVPKDESLIVEAKLRPDDIDAIRAGMRAEVRLLAFKRRTTPTVDGTVTHVSGDLMTEERSGQPYYLARVRVPPENLTAIRDGVELIPGMPAEVIIPTEARTALEYFIQPLTDSFARSFREK